VVILTALIAALCFSTISYYKHPVAVITGVSMLPNYSQDEVHVTTRVFSTPERFRVVLFDSSGFDSAEAQELRDTKNVKGEFAKRVMGIPGDTITYSLDSGLLLTFNDEPVVYKADPSKRTFDLVDSENPSISVGATYLNETIGSQSHSIYSLSSSKSKMTNEQLTLVEDSIIPFSAGALSASVSGDKVTIEVPDGYVLLMSDNRVDGLDSRQMGLLKISSLISVFEKE
jgi:signal peptidase I